MASAQLAAVPVEVVVVILLAAAAAWGATD